MINFSVKPILGRQLAFLQNAIDKASHQSESRSKVQSLFKRIHEKRRVSISFFIQGPRTTCNNKPILVQSLWIYLLQKKSLLKRSRRHFCSSSTLSLCFANSTHSLTPLPTAKQPVMNLKFKFCKLINFSRNISLDSRITSSP